MDYLGDVKHEVRKHSYCRLSCPFRGGGEGGKKPCDAGSVIMAFAIYHGFLKLCVVSVQSWSPAMAARSMSVGRLGLLA